MNGLRIRRHDGGDHGRQLRRALTLNAHLVNLVVLLVGVALVLVSFLDKPSSRFAITFLSVGASVVAAGLVGMLLGYYAAEDKVRDDALREWQLAGIYTTRADMNRSSNARLQSCRRQLDVAAFGLKGFRESQSAVVKEMVRAGVRVRILSLHPDSPFVSAREVSEGEVPGQIRKTILDLDRWVRELQGDAREPAQVEVRYYDALPLDFFFRVDGTVYVGPYLHGYSSQQTISLEFIQPGAGFDFWCEYFESRWKDEDFARPSLTRGDE